MEFQDGWPPCIECGLLLCADDAVLFFSHKNVDVINDQLKRDWFVTWHSINTGLDNVHVIFCIYEQEACYVINILYIVTVY